MSEFKLLPAPEVPSTELQKYALQFQKEKTALKYYLTGRNYTIALRMLGFAERHHVGLRKDKKTPEFHHQIRLAMDAMNLKGLVNEEIVITLCLGHDVQEDYDIPRLVMEKEFGQEIADANWRLTKKFAGESKSKEEYIREMSLCPYASIVKGLDRCDNLESMIGVFTVDKIKSYSKEAEVVFLSMLKSSAKLFPEQHAAYRQVSQMMKQHLRFISAYVDVLEALEKYEKT